MRLIQGMALGDSILLSGAAVYLSKWFNGLRVVCSPEWEDCVRSFYRLYPEIEVYSHLSEWRTKPNSLKMIGSGGLVETLGAGPREWYRQFKVPYSERWDSCPITELAKAIPPSKERVVFIHDDKERGFDIHLEGYRPPRTSSIFDHVPILKSSTEIHCIESAFFHLIESMEPLKAKLFLHRYSKAGYEGIPIRHHWHLASWVA